MNPLIYESKLKKLNNNIDYSSEHLEYIIVSHIYYNYFEQGVSFSDLKKHLEGIFDMSVFKKKSLKTYLDSNFIINKNKNINITILQKDTMENLKTLKKRIKKYKNYTEEDLYTIILNDNYKKDYFELIAINLTLNRIVDCNYLYSEFNKFFYNFLKTEDFDLLSDRAHNCLLNIHNDFNNTNINYIFSNDIVIKKLYLMDIYIINDLKKIDKKNLLILIFTDILNWINLCDKLNHSTKKSIKQMHENIKKSMTNKEEYTLVQRFDFLERKTLNEIAEKYNLTRERIRQIEKKAIRKIKKHLKEKPYFVIYMNTLFREITKEKKLYINQESLLSYIDNEELAVFIIIILEIKDLDFKYSFDYKIIYKKFYKNKEIESLKIIIKDCLIRLEDVILIDNKQLTLFTKILINKFYREIENNYFLKKGVNKSKIYSKILKDNFPYGYQPGNKEHYKLFFDKFNNKYPNMIVPTPRALAVTLERINYIQIDRGTYKHKKECVQLSQDLFNKIINYIYTNSPIVYYLKIYNYFEKQLLEKGVNNHFYLKGLIDYQKLPSAFKTKRDYITTDEKLTSYSVVIQHIKQYEKKFTIDNIQKTYSAVPVSAIKNIINYELKDELLYLSNSTYIFLNQILLSDETKKEIKDFIEKNFIELDSEVISAGKIYSKLTFLRPDILEKIYPIDSSFGLFSLIEKIFPEFYFNRPLISKSSNSDITNAGVIKTHLYKLERFNIETIREYCNLMNIEGIVSVIDFMDKMSADYVQISIDTMVRKEIFNLPETVLEQLKKILNLILRENNYIDTSQFRGYIMFPRILFSWNKYLLVGIVKTYLSDFFEVSNTDKKYLKTDYIIKEVIVC